jgi:hypothetical protein
MSAFRCIAFAVASSTALLFTNASLGVTIYDVTTGQHHPLPLNVPAVPGTEVAGNPVAGNPWVYGSRLSTLAPNPGGVAPTFAAINLQAFVPYAINSQSAADVLGGAGSQGDLNEWTAGNAATGGGGNDASFVNIVDGLGGIGGPTHDIVGFQYTYLRGRVHLFGDQSAPVTHSPIVRFVAPVSSQYNIAMTLENRLGDTDANPNTNIFGNQFYVFTDKGGVLSAIAEGPMNDAVLSGPTAGGLGPGAGFTKVISTSVNLLAGESIEFAAGNHNAQALGGPLFAVYGTITQIPEPTVGTLLAIGAVPLSLGFRRRRRK